MAALDIFGQNSRLNLDSFFRPTPLLVFLTLELSEWYLLCDTLIFHMMSIMSLMSAISEGCSRSGFRTQEWLFPRSYREGIEWEILSYYPSLHTFNSMVFVVYCWLCIAANAILKSLGCLAPLRRLTIDLEEVALCLANQSCPVTCAFTLNLFCHPTSCSCKSSRSWKWTVARRLDVLTRKARRHRSDHDKMILEDKTTDMTSIQAFHPAGPCLFAICYWSREIVAKFRNFDWLPQLSWLFVPQVQA